MKYTDILPLTANNSFALKALVVGDSDLKRLELTKFFYNMYEGNHWAHGSANAVTLNYCGAIVDCKVDFFTKNGFTINVSSNPDDGEGDDKTNREFIKRKLDEVWDANKRNIWFKESVLAGSITGDSVSYISWDQVKQRASIQRIPSQYWFPINDLITGEPIEVDILFPVIVRRTKNPSSKKFSLLPMVRVNNTDFDVYWKRINFTPEYISYYDGDEFVKRDVNILKRIPVVQIKNELDTNSSFGKSDLFNIAKPQQTYNEKMTDLSEILAYHASPQTIFKGASPTDLVRGPDQTWSIPETADVLNLELKADLKSSQEYIKQIKDSILELSNVPEQAINPTKNISNTPGVALHMSYLPLIEDRNNRILLYEYGIQQINEMVIQLHELMDPVFRNKLSKIQGDKYRTSVQFGEALPRDESLTLSNLSTKLELGVDSRLNYLMTDMGLSRADALALIEEADKDAETRSEMQMKSSAKGMPNPVVQGEKVSAKNK